MVLLGPSLSYSPLVLLRNPFFFPTHPSFPKQSSGLRLVVYEPDVAPKHLLSCQQSAISLKISYHLKTRSFFNLATPAAYGSSQARDQI